MDYKVIKNEKSKVVIEMALGQEEWQQELEKAYNKYKGRYAVEGFRKGKAPRKVVEKIHGDNVFFEDALSDSFYIHYVEVLKEMKDIEPIENPTLNVLEISQDGVKVEVTVSVKPEFKLKKYKGFGIEVQPKKVTDKDVEDRIKTLTEQQSRLVEVDRASKTGDVVNIDFEGSVNGKLFDGGTSKAYDLELGSKSFIDTFEDQLVGLKKGDKKDVEVKFPEGYHSEELSGKPAVFKVIVNFVKEKQIPEFGLEFVKDTSEFDTIEEYKADVLKQIEKSELSKAKVELENKVIDKIIENLEIEEIPNALLEQEIDHILHDLEHRLMYQGIDLETYAKYLGTTIEGMRAQYKDEAHKGVKVRLALQYIMKQENIEVTEKDIDAKIEELAKDYKISAKEYKESVNDHMMDHLKEDLLMEKLLNFLIESNK